MRSNCCSLWKIWFLKRRFFQPRDKLRILQRYVQPLRNVLNLLLEETLMVLAQTDIRVIFVVPYHRGSARFRRYFEENRRNERNVCWGISYLRFRINIFVKFATYPNWISRHVAKEEVSACSVLRATGASAKTIDPNNSQVMRLGGGFDKNGSNRNDAAGIKIRDE